MFLLLQQVNDSMTILPGRKIILTLDKTIGIDHYMNRVNEIM
jgi:hypothetical protein